MAHNCETERKWSSNEAQMHKGETERTGEAQTAKAEVRIFFRNGQVFMTSGSIEDFEETSIIVTRKKCTTPPNIVSDAIFTVM